VNCRSDKIKKKYVVSYRRHQLPFLNELKYSIFRLAHITMDPPKATGCTDHGFSSWVCTALMSLMTLCKPMNDHIERVLHFLLRLSVAIFFFFWICPSFAKPSEPQMIALSVVLLICVVLRNEHVSNSVYLRILWVELALFSISLSCGQLLFCFCTCFVDSRL
jgi:hypothetical protein